MAVNKTLVSLRSPKQPNLPIAPTEYKQRYFDDYGKVLRLYFSQIDTFTQTIAIPPSGITADRPTQNVQNPLFVGQFYFDTTLGYPIWWNGTDWVDSSGTVV
jgi:hypothetical protein